MTTLAENQNRRIPELDGLRGIAILLVVSFHYLNNQLIHSENTIAKLISKATSFGWVGVDLFFVLSGFLIGNILLRSFHSKNFFSTFYIRRILRIIPNYFLLLLIFVAINKLFVFNSNIFLKGHQTIPIWSYFAMLHNFFMANLNSMGNAALSITWSIGIEEQFYIVFPFLMLLFRKKGLPYLLAAAIILAPLFRAQYNSWIPAYVLLNCRMDAIAFGILVAWLSNRGLLQQLVERFFYLLLALLLLIVFICAFLFWKYNDLGVFKQTFFSIIFSIALIFALTQKNGWYVFILRFKPLVWVGTISYSLYLFHYIILGVFQHFNHNLNGLGINGVTDVIISMLAFITTLLFSWLVYRFLETPMVNIGKKFSY
jgi:peptidoglycan/LPS O-acetylase OafA/YrhL